MTAAAAPTREQAFAQAALRAGLVRREQAEECLAIARGLAQRGKPLPIEEVFARKGYLSAQDGQALARRLEPRGKVALGGPAAARAEGKLELRDDMLRLKEPQRRECPGCKKDPGTGDDCARCGADQATGRPGPRATICTRCARVCLRGTAICPSCACPIEDDAPTGAPRARGAAGGRSRRGGPVDKVIVAVTLLGAGYFLVYRTFVAPRPQSSQAPSSQDGTGTDAPPPAPGEDDPPVTRALALLRAGDAARAVEVLEAALREARGPDARELRRALALAAYRAGQRGRAREAAEAALRAEDDPVLRVLLARVCLDDRQVDRAAEHLAAVPAARQDDDYHLAAAALDRARGGDGLESLLRLQRPEGAAARQLAQALVARAARREAAGQHQDALADLTRACELAPDLGVAHHERGLLLLRTNRAREAKDALEAAVRLLPRDAAPRLGLGLALEAVGQRAQAVAALREFVRLAGSEQPDRVAQVEERIRRLER